MSLQREGGGHAQPAVRIGLTPEERREIERLVRRRKTGQGLARRARIVLAAAEGLENKQIVARTGSDANTVGSGGGASPSGGSTGYDEPRPGAPRQIGDDEIAAAIQRTLEETPPDATATSPIFAISRRTRLRPTM